MTRTICNMRDLVKILLAYCCALVVQCRLPEQIASHRLDRHGSSRQILSPRKIQRMDPDVLIGKNPDTKTAVLFLGDMLCAYYTRIGHVVGMIRFCNNGIKDENAGSKTKLSEKDLPQVKCDFCKVFGDSGCRKRHCVQPKVADIQRIHKQFALKGNSLPIMGIAV